MSYFMGSGRADTCRHGAEYQGTAVSVTKVELEKRGDFLLYKVTDSTGSATKFRLFWDGECISTVSTEKEARSLLNDFCPLPKKKPGRPKKAA